MKWIDNAYTGRGIPKVGASHIAEQIDKLHGLNRRLAITVTADRCSMTRDQSSAFIDRSCFYGRRSRTVFARTSRLYAYDVSLVLLHSGATFSTREQRQCNRFRPFDNNYTPYNYPLKMKSLRIVTLMAEIFSTLLTLQSPVWQ